VGYAVLFWVVFVLHCVRSLLSIQVTRRPAEWYEAANAPGYVVGRFVILVATGYVLWQAAPF